MTAAQKLAELLKKLNFKNKDLAEKLNISPSVITKWLSEKEKIPHARVSQIADLCGLGADEIDILLGNEPLEFNYRTRNHREFDKCNVSEEVRLRTDFVYEAFVRDYMLKSQFNFEPIRRDFQALNIENEEAYRAGANILRKHFYIPPESPISKSFVNDYIIKQLGVHCYYMSFKSIGMEFHNGNEDDKKAAILFNRGESYGILIDADRNVSSAFFDLLHEIYHILIGKSFPRSKSLEKFIDRAVGELIYPEKYLRTFLLNGRNEGKTGKTSEEIIDIVIEKYNQDRTWSPIGLAKALIDYSIIGKDTKIYEELTQGFYHFYNSHVKTMAEIGKINIDHSSLEGHQKLFIDVIYKDINLYPVYMKLRSKLVSGAINPQTYSKLFSLNLSHVKLLKAIWSEEEIVGELDRWQPSK